MVIALYFSFHIYDIIESNMACLAFGEALNLLWEASLITSDPRKSKGWGHGWWQAASGVRGHRLKSLPFEHQHRNLEAAAQSLGYSPRLGMTLIYWKLKTIKKKHWLDHSMKKTPDFQERKTKTQEAKTVFQNSSFFILQAPDHIHHTWLSWLHPLALNFVLPFQGCDHKLAFTREVCYAGRKEPYSSKWMH